MIQSFVESSWGKEITEDNMELVNKSYILSDYEELESDVVYKANKRNFFHHKGVRSLYKITR